MLHRRQQWPQWTKLASRLPQQVRQAERIVDVAADVGIEEDGDVTHLPTDRVARFVTR